MNANSIEIPFENRNLIKNNSAEMGSHICHFWILISNLCQVEGHGGTLVQLMSENCKKFPSTDLKNILYFDIPMYPSFICHTKFGLSPHGLDFGIFGPLWIESHSFYNYFTATEWLKNYNLAIKVLPFRALHEMLRSFEKFASVQPLLVCGTSVKVFQQDNRRRRQFSKPYSLGHIMWYFFQKQNKEVR